MHDHSYKSQAWYLYLQPSMRRLVNQSMTLLHEELELKHRRFDDYSYLLFPLAKAYEGFLKQLFLDLKLISVVERDDKYFRIGRSFNPGLPDNFKDELWLYDDVERLCRLCGQPDLASKMWLAWLEVRNQIFHFNFVGQKNVDLVSAEKKINQILEVMDEVVSCEILNL